MSHSSIARRAPVALALVLLASCAQGDGSSSAGITSAASIAATSRSDRGEERSGGRLSGTSGTSGSEHGQATAAAAQGKHTISCQSHVVATNAGVFGPSGGTLIVGDSRLVIPGGALAAPVLISGSTDDSTSTIHFEPHGLQFLKPAGLVLSGAGCTLPPDVMPSVVYLDDSGTILETIDASYDPRFKAVTAPIVHFSGYAIAF